LGDIEFDDIDDIGQLQCHNFTKLYVT